MQRCSARAASGAPPCAMSRLPPPRVPSVCTVCFISAPMSLAKPGVCAKTSDGCEPPQPSSATAGAGFRELLRQHLDEAEIALGEELHHQLLWPPRSVADCSNCCACSSATSSSRRCCAFCADLISSSDLRTCCGTSQMWVENTAAASVRVSKSRRAVRDRAQPADKFHAHALLHLLGLAQQDAANLAGAAHVRSAASVQVEVADVDQPQLLALGGRNFAHAHGARFVRRGEANLHRTVFRDDLVGQPLGRLQWLGVTASVARSMVQLSSPMWNETVAKPYSFSKAADSTCWPECCCM